MLPGGPASPAEPGSGQGDHGMACLVDALGDIVWINEAWRHGYQRRVLPRADVAEGANYLAICSRGSADRRSIGDLLRRLLHAESNSFDFEYHCDVPDDTEQHICVVRAQAITVDTRRCAFLVHDDVTAERRAVEALRQGKQRYRQLFDAAPDAVFLLAAEGHEVGRILDANVTAATMHGYSREQLLGMSIADLDVEEERSQVAERIARLRREGHVVFTVRHLHANGTVFPVDVSARLTTIGNRLCVIWFNRDVTERERFLTELRDQRARLDLAVRASRIGFWQWEPPQNRVYLSPEWKAQLGYEPDELPDDFETWRTRLHPDDLEATLATLNAHVEGDTEAYVVEFRLRHRDGTYRWIFVRGEAQRDSAGRCTRMMGGQVDVTVQKEAALEHAALRRRLDQLQRIDVIGTLAGGIAHDFNNVLTIISGNLELALLDEQLTTLTREGLDEARKAAERAKALTRQILSFSRSAPSSGSRVDLADTVTEAVRLLRIAIPRSIELRTTLVQHVAPVFADAEQLQQVLVNLGTNAWHAIGDTAGHIDFELHYDADQDMAVIDVRDDGCGMDEATRQQAFEPMFTTKPPGHGTGFGLSVAKGIVQRHSGTVGCESSLGRGSTFTVRLPIDRSSTPTTVDVQSPVSGLARSGRVLLLDDEPKLLTVMARGLTRLGHHVTSCDNATAALTVLQSTARQKVPAFDVVVTDYGMPSMRGDLFVRTVRERHPTLPIILCSGYLTDDAQRRVLEAGASCVMLKPLRVADLDRTLQDLLPKAP